jgi:hypothetical protein
MTTGRINQITRSEAWPGKESYIYNSCPGTYTPGGVRVYIVEGAHGAPGRSGIPGVPEETRTTIQLPPLSPSAPVRTQVFQPGRLCRRGLAAAYGPRVEGPDPVDNAGGRRIPQGGSLQESRFQVWPAAIHPQTPAVPGTKRPPGFGRCGDTRRGRVQHPRRRPARS